MDNINIAMICDDSYAMPTSVAITSIKNNVSSDKTYNIYLICDEISKLNRRKLLSMKTDRFNIIIKDTNSKMFAGSEKKYSQVSRASQLKFYIPHLLGEIDKVLYIDGDVILLKDISYIYSTEIGKEYAAVVYDGPKEKIAGGKKHAFYGRHDYFNSGVMLLNLKRMRDDDITKKLIDYRMNEYNYFMDQDAFNMVLGNNVTYMSLYYDFMLHLISYRNGKLTVDQLTDFYGEQKCSTIDDLFNHVVLLHYTFEKPWKYYDIPFNEVWMNCFYNSPYAQQELSRTSIMTHMYNTRTYRFSRGLSQFVRTLFRVR